MGFGKYSLAAAALAVSLCGGTVWGEGVTGAVGADVEGVTGAAGAEVKGAAGAAVASTVNINTADQKTLEMLPGIGEVKAKAIIAYREKNGPFKSVADLGKVEGIGDKTVQTLSGLVVIE